MVWVLAPWPVSALATTWSQTKEQVLMWFLSSFSSCSPVNQLVFSPAGLWLSVWRPQSVWPCGRVLCLCPSLPVFSNLIIQPNKELLSDSHPRFFVFLLVRNFWTSGLGLPASHFPHHSVQSSAMDQVKLSPFSKFLKQPKAFKVTKHTYTPPAPEQTKNTQI